MIIKIMSLKPKWIITTIAMIVTIVSVYFSCNPSPQQPNILPPNEPPPYPSSYANSDSISIEQTLDVAGGKLYYRSSIEMAIGACKGVLFIFDPDEPVQTDLDIMYTLHWGDENIRFPISDYFKVVEQQNYFPDSEHTTVTLFKFRAITEAAREYKIVLDMIRDDNNVAEAIPLSIDVIASADDIMPAPGAGSTYRGNIQGPGGQHMTPIEGTSVLIDNKDVRLSYRDYIETGIGGMKTVIFVIHKADTRLEGKNVTYTLGIMENDTFRPLPETITVKESYTYSVPSSDKIQKDYITIVTSPEIIPGDYILYVQVMQDNKKVIGYAPLIVRVLEAWDDIILTENGPEYRVNVTP
jgi:hypothetical protein